MDPMTGAMLTAGAAPVGGLLARAPAGAVGMNVYHGTPHKFAQEPDFPQRQADMPGSSPASSSGLMDVLDARAAEMDLPAKKRVQPRADQPGVIETTPEAYERQPIKFDEDSASLAPRRPDDKPYPKGDRVRALIDRRDEIAAKLAERAEGQLGTNTQFFYHTGPIYEAAIKAGLSPDEARAWLRDFSQAYAATSPRTETAQNLRNATLAMAKRDAGIPYRDVIGSGTGGISEKGYPMMTGKGGIHGLLLDAVEGPGINRATNPKPATFAGNVEGNLSGVTADTHAIRGALDALNEIEPGSIPEQWIKPKFREQYKKDSSSLDPATMIDDTLASAKIDGKDMQVEYGPVADVYVRMAEMMGVSPAEAQSMGWFGSGARTGLASESKTIAELVNDRIDVTAQLLDITPEEAARKLFRREIPLAMNPASAAIPGLLMGNPAMSQQQMQSLLGDPYGA
jgi:plasmid maintenance system antidote protein VapI